MSQDPHDMYKKPAAFIKDLKLEWKEKVEEQKRLGVSDEEVANLKEESGKYELLAKLKNNMDKPGPFTSSAEVREYSSLPLDHNV